MSYYSTDPVSVKARNDRASIVHRVMFNTELDRLNNRKYADQAQAYADHPEKLPRCIYLRYLDAAAEWESEAAVRDGRASVMPRIGTDGQPIGLDARESSLWNRNMAMSGRMTDSFAAEQATYFLRCTIASRPVLQPLVNVKPITADRTQAPTEEFRYVAYSTEHEVNGRHFSPILFSAKFATFDDADTELDSLVEARKAAGGKVQVRVKGGRWQDCYSQQNEAWNDIPKPVAGRKSPSNQQPRWDDIPELSDLDECRISQSDYIRMVQREAYENGWTLPDFTSRY